VVCKHLARGERHDWIMMGSTPQPDPDDYGWVCAECADRISQGPYDDAEENEKVQAMLILCCRSCVDEMRRRSAMRN
jgi:hypothetical protein